ncbi:MAG TPA: hypothetical protein DCE33_16395, partial [Rhodospirillaceae bacterium]|nr:hypothetical protein [Rhodospirillaceae bacterium]
MVLKVLVLFYSNEMIDPLPDTARKGRGAVSNLTGRFEPEIRFMIDDGWNSGVTEDAAPTTTLAVDQARTVITYNRSPDLPFDRSI